MANVHVIEVGFGNSAVVTSVDKQTGKPNILCFPSIVAKVSESKNDLNSGLSLKKTIQVEVDSVLYEVGPDAHLAVGTDSGRVLNSEYIRSSQYKALLFGSMAYIENEVIDVLVLGLPVNSWKRRKELKELALGTHKVNGKTYTVKDVWCVPQPLGGLFQYSTTLKPNEFKDLETKNIVSFDPGMLTADWLVSRGLLVNDSRSDAVDKGMSTVLRGVSDSLKAAFQLDKLSTELVDDAFWRHKGVLRLFGKEYTFPSSRDIHGMSFDCQPAIDAATDAAVTDMRNLIGDGADIQLFLMMGGAAEVYKPAVQRAYPRHEVIVLENNLTSICEGMYYGGVEYAKQMKASRKEL